MASTSSVIVAENRMFCFLPRIIDKIEVNWVLKPKFNISSNSSITNFCKQSNRKTPSKPKSITRPGVPTKISTPIAKFLRCVLMLTPPYIPSVFTLIYLVSFSTSAAT